MRCFIAVELPKEAKEKVVSIQNIIRAGQFFDKKFTEENNLHLTLKFLGECEESDVEVIKNKLHQIKHTSFDARVSEFGVFSKSFVKVVWLKVIGADELQKKVDLVLADLFEKEERFMGHLTIARPKQDIKEKEQFLKFVENLKVENFSFKVSSFILFKSVLEKSGPAYTKLEEFKLDN